MKKYYFLSREKIVQNKKFQTTETNPSILKILKKNIKNLTSPNFSTYDKSYKNRMEFAISKS